MERPVILVVEDEDLMRQILRRLLESEGYSVVTADSAETAMEAFSRSQTSVTITDIKMRGHDGLDLLDHIKSIDETAVVIIMTAFSSVESAVAALRKGAYDYITKPFINEDLLQTVRNALTQRQLFNENKLLKRELRRQQKFADMIGTSDAMRNVLDRVLKVADSNATVLIQGETGTGKELIARAIHRYSDRADGPFLAVNCGALPEHLLESELFGHVKGAFTGAVNDKLGLFRSASNGTIFLDEIGELPPSLQVKLLRALQERDVTPVGAAIPIRFNARVLAATNKKLEDELAAGRFRKDLYYRLNVVEIDVPPLRERRDDIPLLARHFAQRSTIRKDGSDVVISPAAISALMNYDWPGNIRELENVIEHSLILNGSEISRDALPPTILGSEGLSEKVSPTLNDVEREYVLTVLGRMGGDKSAAAALLDIDLSTLYRKLKKYNGN